MPIARRAATFLGSAACPGASGSSSDCDDAGYVPISPRPPQCRMVRIFAALVSGQDSPRSRCAAAAPAVCLPVTAMVPPPDNRAAQIEDAHIRNGGPEARESPAASPPPTSTSNIPGRQNRSRPARKTQNCRVGSACFHRLRKSQAAPLPRRIRRKRL